MKNLEEALMPPCLAPFIHQNLLDLQVHTTDFHVHLEVSPTFQAQCDTVLGMSLHLSNPQSAL